MAVALIAWELVLAGGVTAADAKRPNMVFIFTDDHSLQTIGAYRERLSAFCRKQNVTPNIDRLAARGGLFVNSFCGNSLCSPSRASILSGLHSHANGVRTLSQPIREGVWTFPGALREAGYQTAVIGKWHLGKTPTGTDYWRLLDGQGTYWHPEFRGPDGVEKRAGYATDLITEMSLDWLRQRDRTKPFMVMIQHKAPHRLWMPPPRYYSWLTKVKVPEPPTLFDDYAGRQSPARAQKMEISGFLTMEGDLKVLEPGKWVQEFNRMTAAERAEWSAVFGPRNEAFLKAKLAGRELTRWKYQEFMKDYLRCIKAVDDGVGDVVKYLQAEGLEENTVVIYASDQGFFNGEHGWFDKRWIYEESIHMPFIIRWPGVVKPGTRFTPFIQNIDYAPTFVELAGGRIPDGLHGRSLVPILRGETPADWRRSVYYHYYDHDGAHNVANHYGVRTDRYTLARYYATDEWELFDNQKDPRQLRSVYDDSAYARTLESLRGELGRLRTLYQDADGPGVNPEK